MQTFAATITNLDTGCAAQTFALTHAEPSGLTGMLGSASVMLAAGSATTVSDVVTSQGSAPTANNTISVTATGAASGSGAGSAIDGVTAACVRAAPQLTLAPSSQTARAGEAAMYLATLTDEDVGCADATIAVTEDVPAGWTASATTGAVSLAAGASTTLTVTVTSAADAVPGTDAIRVTATPPASAATIATASYVVEPPADGAPQADAGIAHDGASGADAGSSVHHGGGGCAAGGDGAEIGMLLIVLAVVRRRP
jgi:hypothetical protein